jgi:hypothetical protein
LYTEPKEVEIVASNAELEERREHLENSKLKIEEWKQSNQLFAAQVEEKIEKEKTSLLSCGEEGEALAAVSIDGKSDVPSMEEDLEFLCEVLIDLNILTSEAEAALQETNPIYKQRKILKVVTGLSENHNLCFLLYQDLKLRFRGAPPTPSMLSTLINKIKENEDNPAAAFQINLQYVLNPYGQKVEANVRCGQCNQEVEKHDKYYKITQNLERDRNTLQAELKSLIEKKEEMVRNLDLCHKQLFLIEEKLSSSEVGKNLFRELVPKESVDKAGEMASFLKILEEKGKKNTSVPPEGSKRMIFGNPLSLKEAEKEKGKEKEGEKEDKEKEREDNRDAGFKLGGQGTGSSRLLGGEMKPQNPQGKHLADEPLPLPKLPVLLEKGGNTPLVPPLLKEDRIVPPLVDPVLPLSPEEDRIVPPLVDPVLPLSPEEDRIVPPLVDPAHPSLSLPFKWIARGVGFGVGLGVTEWVFGPALEKRGEKLALWIISKLKERGCSEDHWLPKAFKKAMPGAVRHGLSLVVAGGTAWGAAPVADMFYRKLK